MVQALLIALRRFNKENKLGLEVDKILDSRFGKVKSEKVQEEICEIMLKIVKQLRIDRKGGENV